MSNADEPLLATGLPEEMTTTRLGIGLPRLTNSFRTSIEAVSDSLLGLTTLIPPMGDWKESPRPWRFHLVRPAWVLLSVHQIGEAGIEAGWTRLRHGVVWRMNDGTRFHADMIYARHFPAGTVEIPGHAGRMPEGWCARPHLVMLSEELPAEPAAGQDSEALYEELARVEEVALAAGGLAATVQVRPCVRLTSFSDGELPSLLASTGKGPTGLRTWFMEPHQIPPSPRPGCCRARLTDRGEAHCALTTGEDPLCGLELLWEVRLDPVAKVLRLRQGLRNHQSSSRRLAVWSLIVGSDAARMCSVLGRDAGVAAPAMQVKPVDDGSGDPPAITAGTWDYPGVHDLPDGLVLDGAALGGRLVKLGLRAREGAAALALDRVALVSRVPAHDDGSYPEGGLNLTTYRSRSVAEIEHVGPLVDVAPGATVWMDQELQLRRLPEGTAPRDLPALCR